MAFIELHFHSDALGRSVAANVILPENTDTMIGMETTDTKGVKTIYLLHGLTDDHTTWMRRSSIERYASERGIAVVMPNVDRSWYTDTTYSAKYFTYITEELPAICSKFFKQISGKREDTYIGGLSMGGYGAVKAAFTYPEKYAGCVSLSGALDVQECYRKYAQGEWDSIFGEAEYTGSANDVFFLSKKAVDREAELPRVFMWCGLDDGLLDINRRFHDHLEELSIPHIYLESEGRHNWKWWDMYIQDAIDYLMK